MSEPTTMLTITGVDGAMVYQNLYAGATWAAAIAVGEFVEIGTIEYPVVKVRKKITASGLYGVHVIVGDMP